MRILLLSEITLLKNNVSRILSPIVGIALKTNASIVHVHLSLFVSMVLWNEIQCALIFAILHVFFFHEIIPFFLNPLSLISFQTTSMT